MPPFFALAARFRSGIRLWCLMLGWLGGGLSSAWALTPVTLQLKWTHAFQFAGYYAALEQGYYRDAGLDVTLQPAAPGTDVVARVVAGQADFGVGSSGLLLERKAGQPVVALAVIFQHSPLVLLARLDNPDASIHDLVGGRLMLEPHAEELLAYLKREGIARKDFTQVDHGFDPQALIQGRVDAISAYSTNETYWLDQARIPYQLLTPRSAGIDFYGDNLFTSETMLARHPEQVAAFREASLRGWRYALDHPEELVGLIHQRYAPELPVEFLRYEARQMRGLIRPELVDIGYMNPGRWRHMADTYAELGMLPADFPLTGFLWEPPGRPEFGAVHASLALAVGLVLLVSGGAAYVWRANRGLAASLASLNEAKVALTDSEALFRTLADTTAAGIYLMRGSRFVMVNSALVTLTGYQEEELLNRDFHAFIHPDHRKFVSDIAFARQRGESVPCRYEFKILSGDGGERWVELTAGQMLLGGEAASIGTVYDITERKAVEERSRYLAQHDFLTGLANRSLFTDRLRQAILAARRDGRHFALMFLDLDRFKPINDSLGHGIGDLLLRAVAESLRACLRESDTVARIGGDEFVIIARSVEDEASACGVAEKIRLVLDQPFSIDGHRLAISCSIGIALYPEHGEDDIVLVKHADAAMYEAKKAGRDQVKVFSPGTLVPDDDCQ